MFKDKNLLVLSHTYNSFIKDPVEIMAKDFNKIYVLVRYSPISELGNFIPIPAFRNRRKYSKRYAIDLKNKPNNVKVILLPLWYLPFNFFYKNVGKQHARSALEVLKKQNIQFDIIHAHFAWSAGYAGMKVKEKYQKPLIITGHGYDIYDLPFRSADWAKKIEKVLSSADDLIAVSNFTKKFFEDFNPQVILNGFSKKLFKAGNKKYARKKLNLPEDRKIILTVGNLEKVKGYDFLIKALKIVSKERKDFLCIHIGEGLTNAEILRLIKKYKLQDNVKLMGRQPHYELVHWYQASDIFVSSSLSETGPVVMFESLACGRPYIGTAVGTTTDVIISPEYGKLSKPKDYQTLAKNIVWGLEQKWDEGKIVKYAEKYTWDNTVKNIFKIYKRYL